MQQQQPGQSGQQGMMMEPPQVLSTKDQLYLSDMLNWNLIAAKKANFYAGQCTNSDIKSECQRVAQMHEQHYQTFLSQLQQHSQQGG
ncbi:hypothetical protein [Natribacillus halophilus]|nr:hypothetical protein [Natribacillus halophilus]